ncbi:MAG TPA: T9SS type A sorting domain-containing protein [Candidatus Marinimicrobia bacterium]|nr:T9SS type A sorting domain-containing protein [Candidatus Neomarinimicrobiota bacterium]
MKKGLLLFVVFCLVLFSNVFADGVMDYVDEVRGDTLVIKDYVDMGNVAGSLTEAVVADSVDVPAGRVYELKANGYYPLSTNLTTPADRAVIIVGADDRRLVTNDDEMSAPPVICGFGGNTGGINFQNDLTVKNASIIQAADKATLGWAFFGAAAANKTLRVENCLFEHTRWVMIQSNDAPGTNVYINDCYFVNMSGQACRRNGGVYDNVNNNTATMWVENSTHVMAQGMIYKFRNYQVGEIVFNHNTFVNMSGQVFETLGYQSDMIVVNNIFVNSNLQPYMTGLDYGETDADYLPMGIINVDTLPSGYDVLPRKMMVDANVVYWDPKFADMVQICIDNQVNQSTDWHSQMITMNSRTQAMFDDDTNYPYLVEGTWYEKCPNFTNPEDLLTVGVDSIRAFSIGTVDTLSGDVLMVWRKVLTDLDNYYVYSDWPIPIDLSYDDADLLEGGINGFPVGDLNWFPAEKAAWEAQKSAEYAAIDAAIDAGHPVAIRETVYEPTDFRLSQNYPNPFNPTTTISYTLPKAGNVTLTVYNSLGQEVMTLVNNEFKASAGSYNVHFDGSGLSSGIYFYTLTFNNNTIAKKMVLMK